MLVIMWNIYKIVKQVILYRIEGIGSGSILKRPLSRLGNLFQKQHWWHFISPFISFSFCPFLPSLTPSLSLCLSLLCPFSVPVFPPVPFLFLSLRSLWLRFPATASSNHRLQSTPPGTLQPTSIVPMEANHNGSQTQVQGNSRWEIMFCYNTLLTKKKILSFTSKLNYSINCPKTQMVMPKH